MKLNADLDNKTRTIHVTEPDDISAEYVSRNPGFLGSVFVPASALKLERQLVFVDVYKTPLLFVETPDETVKGWMSFFESYLFLLHCSYQRINYILNDKNM